MVLSGLGALAFLSNYQNLGILSRTSGLCERIENVWESQQDYLAPLLQSVRCEANTCFFDDNNQLWASYFRRGKGCAIQMNNSYADMMAKLDVFDDTLDFSTTSSGNILTGKTDYANFVHISWQSPTLEFFLDDNGALSFEEVLNKENLKIDRLKSLNGENGFQVELEKVNKDEETRFSAECYIGENEGRCEIKSGNLISDWFLKNTVRVNMEKSIDPETEEKAYKFTVEETSLLGLAPPIQLGEFEVKLNSNGEMTAQGNVRIPGRDEPLFVGRLHCKDLERNSCSGEAVFTNNSLAPQLSQKANVHFEYTPTEGHAFFREESNFIDFDYHRITEQNWKFSKSENGENEQFSKEDLSKVESALGDMQFHTLQNFQWEMKDGVKAEYWLKDISDPVEGTTQIMDFAYYYNTSCSEADTAQMRLQTVEEFKTEVKVRLPKHF